MELDAARLYGRGRRDLAWREQALPVCVYIRMYDTYVYFELAWALEDVRYTACAFLRLEEV